MVTRVTKRGFPAGGMTRIAQATTFEELLTL
jgi:hypothetical protein